MYTPVHRCAHTFVYLWVLIRINAYSCVFMCVLLLWEWVWNSSARIRECCGHHCCVLQNHDYFLSLHPLQVLPHPPSRSLQEGCLSVCLQISVASHHVERNESCVDFFGSCKGLPLLHLGLWKIPQPITAATKRRHFLKIEQHLRNSAEDRGQVHIHVKKLCDG